MWELAAGATCDSVDRIALKKSKESPKTPFLVIEDLYLMYGPSIKESRLTVYGSGGKSLFLDKMQWLIICILGETTKSKVYRELQFKLSMIIWNFEMLKVVFRYDVLVESCRKLRTMSMAILVDLSTTRECLIWLRTFLGLSSPPSEIKAM